MTDLPWQRVAVRIDNPDNPICVVFHDVRVGTHAEAIEITRVTCFPHAIPGAIWDLDARVFQ